MKKITFVLIMVFTQLLLFVSTSFSQSGWFLVYTASQTLNAVQFVNVNTGYAVGMSGVILKTTDGGNTWINKPANTNNNFRGVYFVDANTGTVVGESGSIFRTTNGGGNWNYQSNPVGNYTMNNVYFINANTGCIVGFSALHQDGLIMMTTNGGDAWMNRSYTHDASYNDVHFFNQTTGIVVSQIPGIIKTSNACLNWSVQNPNSTIYGISFSDTINGVCVGSNGKILQTTNSGNNWNIYNTGITNHFFGVSHGSRDAAVIVGSGGIILRTTNAGINWFTQQSNLNTALRSVSFINSSTGWAVGESGKIIKTVDGGGSLGIQPISTEIPSSFSLSQNYPNPFNPSTTIKFDIVEHSAGRTFLSVYNILGREVATLVNEQLAPGTYSVDWNASGFTSGVYFYKLTTDGFSETKKMVLMK